MKKISWITGALIALLGLLIVIFPSFWLKVFVILLGLGSIVYGVYNIKVTKDIYENPSYEKAVLLKSLVNVLVGIFAVVLPLSISGAMWTIMVYILAVYLIVTSALGFYSVTLLKDTEIDRNRYVLENLGLLIGAVFLFLIPTKSLGIFILRLLGIFISVLGIIMLVIDITSQKSIFQTETNSDENEGSGKSLIDKIKFKSKKSVLKNTSDSDGEDSNNDSDDTIVAEAIITEDDE